MAQMRVELGHKSDPGRDPTKQINEDACGHAHTRLGHLFVVCDGMGGHSGGKQASALAVRTVIEVVSGSAGDADRRAALRAAIEEAGRRVFELGGQTAEAQRPGSTCVALLLEDGQLEVAHVGDSRAYALRGNRVWRLTRDHSLVREMVDAGVLSEHEALDHPDANKITRALGMTPNVEVELGAEPMAICPGDVYLLATDGLTDLVGDDELGASVQRAVGASGPQAACDELVALANDRGGHDNITVQLVRVAAVGPRRKLTVAQQPRFVEAGGEQPALTAHSAGSISPTEFGVPADSAEAATAVMPAKTEATSDGGEQPVAPTAPGEPAPMAKEPGPSSRATEVRQPTAAAEGLAAAADEASAHHAAAAPLAPVSTTVPDAPGPGVAEPTSSLGTGGRALSSGALPAVPPPSRAAVGRGPSKPQPLLYVVLAMGVVITVLVAALAWLLLSDDCGQDPLANVLTGSHDSGIG